MATPSNPLNAQTHASTGQATPTFSNYAVSTGNNRLLLIAACIETSGVTMSSISRDSQSFTKIGTSVVEGINELSLWGLLAPNVNTTNVNFTLSAIAALDAVIWYHTGSEQVLPSEGFDSASISPSGASIDVDVITAGAERMVVAACGLGDANAIASSETLIDQVAGGSTACGAGYAAQATAGTRNMEFTFTSSLRPMIIGVAIKPVESGFIPIRRRRNAIGIF